MLGRAVRQFVLPWPTLYSFCRVWPKNFGLSSLSYVGWGLAWCGGEMEAGMAVELACLWFDRGILVLYAFVSPRIALVGIIALIASLLIIK